MTVRLDPVRLDPVRPPAVRTGGPPVFTGSSFPTQVAVLTGRSLRAMIRDPGIVIFGLIQPVVVLFVLTQVFSNMGLSPNFPPGLSLLDYVLPAVLVDNAVQAATQSGVGLVEDLRNGVVARLRSLPISPMALLTARSLVGVVRAAVQSVVILLLAITVLGFSPDGGPVDIALATVLTLFISFAMGWTFIAAGCWLRRAEPLQNLSLIVIFPLLFASSAYVPVADLPPWLGAVARVNPLTYAIDATRALSLGIPGVQNVLPAAVISAVIVVVAAVAAQRGFRRPL